MNERQPPAHDPAGGPWGPPPLIPPILAPRQPYADPFLAMTGDPAPEPPKRRREGLWVAIAAVLGAAAVIAGVAWYTQRDTAEEPALDRDLTPRTTQVVPDDESNAAPETADGQSPDESPVGGVNAVCPDGTRQEVCDAARFVEDFRGRPFQTFPIVEFADDADFQERFRELNDESLDDEAIAETKVGSEVLGSLGLIAPGVDLLDVSRQLSELSVVGFYDTESMELLVRGTDVNPYVELIIVHELVHAHDDQWVDLDLSQFDDVDDESGLAYLSLVEGNATRVENAWRAQLSDDKEDELSRAELALFSPEDIAVLQQLPPFLLQTQFSPYQDGPVLVGAIVDAAGGGEAGERAVDQAFANPPTTSEQVLHPEQYLSGDAGPTLPAPAASGEIIDEGVIGELVFDIWFGDRVGDGWNGDRYVSFERGGQTCTVIHVAADSNDDLDEFFDAAADWVGDAEDDDVRRSDQSRISGIAVVIIEGCR